MCSIIYGLNFEEKESIIYVVVYFFRLILIDMLKFASYFRHPGRTNICVPVVCSTARSFHSPSSFHLSSSSSSSSSSSKSSFDVENLTKSARTIVDKAAELFDIQYRRSIEKLIHKKMPKKSMVKISNKQLLYDMLIACTLSMNIYKYHETFVQQCQIYAQNIEIAKQTHAIVKAGEADGCGEIFSNDSLVLLNILAGKKEKETNFDTSLCCAYFIRPSSSSASSANPSLIAEDGTLWIVCRGTANGMDVLTDATWMIKTEPIQDTNVHTAWLVGQRCNQIIAKLQPMIRMLQSEDQCSINRIGFVGHSLGGAVATSLYTHYMMSPKIDDSLKLPAFVITIGAPLTFHRNVPFETPSNNMLRRYLPAKMNELLAMRTSKLSSRDASTQELMLHNVHNIVHNLDIVPRIVGRHKLPSYLQEGEVGKMVKRMLNLASVDREEYRTFGHYYSLRHPITISHITKKFFSSENQSNALKKTNKSQYPKDIDNIEMEENDYLIKPNEELLQTSVVNKSTFSSSLISSFSNSSQKSGLLVEIKDPELFLSIFPENLAEFAFAVTDHSISKSVEDIEQVEIQGSQDVFSYIQSKLNLSSLFDVSPSEKNI